MGDTQGAHREGDRPAKAGGYVKWGPALQEHLLFAYLSLVKADWGEYTREPENPGQNAVDKYAPALL